MVEYTGVFSKSLKMPSECFEKRESSMLDSFTCHNFRNIDVTDLKFGRINLLIGSNNSGKSNFIKALTFFSEMLKGVNEGGLNSAFLNATRRNGWEHMLNVSASSGTPIEFSWKINLLDTPVEYGFKFVVGADISSCSIVSETLDAAEPSEVYYSKAFNFFQCHTPYPGTGFFSTAKQKGDANKRIRFDIDSRETIAMQFKDILLRDKRVYNTGYVRKQIAELLYRLQEFFEGFSVFAGSQFNTIDIRKPAEIRNVDIMLNKTASNFVNIFNNYKAKDLRWKSEFVRYMQQLIPGIRNLDSAVLYDKLVFKMIHEDFQLDLTDVSEGTIKGLILNTIINMPMKHKCSLLAIDEPEINLHPAWQKVIGNWIQTSDNFDQCFISTHSPDLLDSFTEGFRNGDVAVFVFSTNENCCNIKRIAYKDIAEELGDWELGDLYRTNDPALGGWPW